MIGKHNLEQALPPPPSDVLEVAARIHTKIKTVAEKYQDSSNFELRMRARYVDIGRNVLQQAVIDITDQSEAAMTLRMAQEMGDAGFMQLWQAKRIAKYVSIIKEQLTQQPGSSYFWLSESNDGLAIEAGNVKGEPSWAIDGTSPVLVLSSEGEHPFNTGALTSVMTDTFSSPQLIYNRFDPEVLGEKSYRNFLQRYLGKGGEGTFPEGASMLAIGDRGTRNLLCSFYDTVSPYYAQTDLGYLELKRFLAKTEDIIDRKSSGEEFISIPTITSFRQLFKDVINQELSEELPSQWRVPYEQVIRNWFASNTYPDLEALAERVTTCMYIKCDPSSAGITYADLLSAVRREIQDELSLQQQISAAEALASADDS